MDFSWKTESTIMKNATRSNRYILVSSNAQLIRSSYSDWGKNWWLWSRNIDDQTPEAIKKHPVCHARDTPGQVRKINVRWRHMKKTLH